MKNFLQPGNSLDLIAPAGGVISGLGYVLGSILVFAQATKAAGETFAGVNEGVIKAAKLTTDVMAVGVKVNYNNTNKEFQIATSDLDGTGIVVEAAGNGDTDVKIKLIQA